ncbi:MAG: hypothetical protein DHS80DRAFT_33135 [Piptocephalis tieghemiana]|nr:MAG: hypothetical protein DHS80DRAFT_33135 [Piptocephalis tieghemiana]
MDDILNFARDQDLEKLLTAELVLGLIMSLATPFPSYAIPFTLFGFYALHHRDNAEPLKLFVSFTILGMVADLLMWIIQGFPALLAALAGIVHFLLKPILLISALETVRARGDHSFRPNFGGWASGERANSLFNADTSYDPVAEVHVDMPSSSAGHQSPHHHHHPSTTTTTTTTTTTPPPPPAPVSHYDPTTRGSASSPNPRSSSPAKPSTSGDPPSPPTTKPHTEERNGYSSI